jgi:hypothetical protein
MRYMTQANVMKRLEMGQSALWLHLEAHPQIGRNGPSRRCGLVKGVLLQKHALPASWFLEIA